MPYQQGSRYLPVLGHLAFLLAYFLPFFDNLINPIVDYIPVNADIAVVFMHDSSQDITALFLG
jgi:uncharacterized Tic20 family protein